MARLFNGVVAQSSLVVRKLGAGRGGELSAHRVLGSKHVTPHETLACFARRTAAPMPSWPINNSPGWAALNHSAAAGTGLLCISGHAAAIAFTMLW